MRFTQHLMVLASMLCAATLFAGGANGQAYPTKPINIVVPFGPGGQTDIMARLIANEMQRIAGQPVLIENKPGGAGVIAVDYIVKAGGDGYTVGFLSPVGVFMPAIVNPSVQNDPLKVLTPVIQLSETVALFMARTELPVANLKELIALAKRSSQAQAPLSIGSSGTGTTKAPYPIELLKSMANIDFTPIYYKGEQPIIVDMLANRLDVGYFSPSTALQYIKSGRMKPIAIMGPNRHPMLPDLQTVSETVPGYDVNFFFGLFVPVATPREVIEKLYAIAAEAVKVPAVSERLRSESVTPVGARPEVFAARLRVEAALYTKLMK